MIDIDVGTKGPAKDVYSAFALESDIYDLKRMLHAAELLQIDGDGDEDSASSARLLVEKAAKMANDFHEKFRSSMWKICSKVPA
jgi:hypothetical protein